MAPLTSARPEPDDANSMPHDQERVRKTSRLTGGSLIAIMLVFGFMTIVVVAILLGALTITIGVVLLVVPAAVIARLARTRRAQR
jgi:Flp pilus assembly protein TadB